MNNKADLLSELLHLRQSIKETYRKKTGKNIIVCTDEALQNIANFNPKSLNEFNCIEGIGANFINNYAEMFLRIIKEYNNTTESNIEITPKISSILKEFENKLININRRNKLLYIPKISKLFFDLHIIGNSNLTLLLKGKKITLCNRLEKKKNLNIDYEAIYKKLSVINRENIASIRDKGINDLYIAYPFVIGKLTGENFNVRAPLILFPVFIEQNINTITVQLDDTREIIYNTTLILAHLKFNNAKYIITYEDIEFNEFFINDLIQYYAKYDMIIKHDNELLSEFKEYKQEDFPKYENGELYIENTALLGKFPIYSNSIQKDYEDILSSNNMNLLINNLLSEVTIKEDNLFFGDLEENKEIETKLDLSEKELTYVNELDIAQENVLLAINNYDNMVIQGPPGTGKSQTITALIIDHISKGKNVMLVSEKKTALDVVYSRLGELSNYTMLLDEVGNKELFYTQLNKILSKHSEKSEITDLYKTSIEIDNNISKLNSIAKKMYTVNTFGIEPYKLYHINKHVRLHDEAEYEKIEFIQYNLNPKILTLSFNELNAINNKFSNIDLTRKLNQFYILEEKYPWLRSIKTNLSQYNIYELKKTLQVSRDKIEQHKQKNIILRIVTQFITYKLIKKDLSNYFNNTKHVFKHILNNIENIIDSIHNYTEYIEINYLYNELTPNEKMYYDTLQKMHQTFHINYEELNTFLFNSILYKHIESFEKDNQDVLHYIYNFNNIILSTKELIKEKKTITMNKLLHILQQDISNLKNTKRYSEIQRLCNNKRKWNVSKLIHKFEPELLTNIKVWLLTPEVVSEIMPLQSELFDLIIFDEASQIFIEKSIPTIYRAKKIVVAGDHKQLKPTRIGVGRLDSELNEEDDESMYIYEESLLDLARFRYMNIMLNYHYRSEYEELINFSNYAFYNGKLYISPNNQKNIKPIEVHHVNGAKWINRCNIEEAKYIVKLLHNIFTTRKNNESIGIITFNINQKELIEDLIEQETIKDIQFRAYIENELNRIENNEDKGLFIKNIESVQGDERDIIIFSIGYAQNEQGKIVRNFGWLNKDGGENRLNVAISRAKKKIYVVLSFNIHDLYVEDLKSNGPKLLKKYLEYANFISNNDTTSAKNLLFSLNEYNEINNHTLTFDSVFEEEVYDALTEKGYNIQTQVGVGGYRIDLAVIKDNKYILGIECDGKLYHSSKNARERDYHRQKFLESRGWKIVRIWSSNWWKDKQKEINKISLLIDLL